MNTEITTGILLFENSKFKQILKDLDSINEFRNQLTIDQITYDQHSRDSLKAIGTAKYLIEILQYISRDNIVTWIKEGKSIKEVQIRQSK